MNPESSSPTKPLPIFIPISHPRLLEGLEVWLTLGLINDAQVRELGQKYLSCKIINRVPTQTQNNDFTEEMIAEQVSQPRIRTRVLGGVLTNAWQAFRDELSVRWLLFLGLFLVVLSSAVLAGTQWQNIPKLAQYLILWLYTMIFGFVGGAWLKRQNNLGLTSQTLETISWLLIPVNFWAMDTFRLWESMTGLLIAGVASLSLLGILYFFGKSRLSLLFLFNFLSLSLLHLGWAIKSFPLIAVYSGIIFTGIILVFLRGQDSRNILGKSLILYGIGILLIRATFVFQLPLQDLGLAIGLMGWLFPYYSSRETSNIIRLSLEVIAFSLLSLGWVITVFSNLSLQAIIISLLAIQFFWKRLYRGWWFGDLLALFFVGFQLLFRLRDLLPIGIKKIGVNFWIALTGDTEYFPEIYGMTLFPYIIVWVIFSQWLFNCNREKLSRLAEFLALGLGIALTVVSLGNNTGRSINLFLSTATLVYILNHRPIRIPLLYFTHLIGLVTISSIINTFYPNLDASRWAIIIITLMVIEWIISSLPLSLISAHLSRSCWYFGFILSAIAYGLSWIHLPPVFNAEILNFQSVGWLLTPITLTYVAFRNRGNHRQIAVTFSCVGLILAQTLTFWQFETRIIGLGVAVGLMLVNSFYINQRFATRLHIGFILAIIFALVGKYGFNSENLINLVFSPNWILVNAIILASLWLVTSTLQSQQNALLKLYSSSLREWGIGLCIWNLTCLTLHLIGVIFTIFTPHWKILVSCFLIGASLLYYSRKQLDNFTVNILVWLGEIIAVESILARERDFLAVSWVNLLLGFIVFAVTRRLLSRYPSLNALKYSPFVFALMAIFWRLGDWTAFTGFITFLASIISLGVSIRLEKGKFLTYLSLIGVSVSIYELVLYQASQNPIGNIANLYLILCLVIVAIASFYRFLAFWCHQKNKNSLFSLSLPEIKTIAHSHWLLAVILKLCILFASRPSAFLLISSLIVSLYAIFQGRNNRKDFWIYLGGADLWATLILFRWFWEELGRYDPFYGALSCVFAFFLYNADWPRWGWRRNSWRNLAVILPVLTAFLSFMSISYFSLLIIAVFYAQISLKPQQIRWSYVSLAFVNWAIFRFFVQYDLTDILFYVSVIGMSILYIAWVDPDLQRQRDLKHYWRVGGSGIICLTALLLHQDAGGLLPSVISLLTVLIGLGTRIRAFLFVGTITFILTVSYQLIVLSFEYSLLKWMIGLIVGILILTVAAIFERLREQIITLWRNIWEQLRQWE